MVPPHLSDLPTQLSRCQALAIMQHLLHVQVRRLFLFPHQIFVFLHLMSLKLVNSLYEQIWLSFIQFRVSSMFIASRCLSDNVHITQSGPLKLQRRPYLKGVDVLCCLSVFCENNRLNRPENVCENKCLQLRVLHSCFRHFLAPLTRQRRCWDSWRFIFSSGYGSYDCLLYSGVRIKLSVPF